MRMVPSRLRLGVIATAALLLAGAVPARAEIRWETRLDRARDASLQRNQPLLIEFWATWCTFCEEMDRDVYSDARVVAAINKVRPVRIDIDAEPVAARKYAVSATPTLVVTDSFGNEIFRYSGSLSRDRMLELLAALPADIAPINQQAAALARDKDDFAALERLGGLLREAGFYRSSSEYYDRALRTRDGRRAGEARALILLDLGRNAADLRLDADAGRAFAQALRDFPGRPWEAEAMLGLGRALLAQDRGAEARKVLADLAARHRSAPAAAEAAALLAR